MRAGTPPSNTGPGERFTIVGTGVRELRGDGLHGIPGSGSYRKCLFDLAVFHHRYLSPRCRDHKSDRIRHLGDPGN